MKIVEKVVNESIPRLARPCSRTLGEAAGPILIVKRIETANYARVLVVIDDEVPDATVLIDEARSLAPDAKMVLLYVMQFTLEDRFRYMDASEEKLCKVRMQRHEEALDAMNAIRKTAGLCSSEVTTVVDHGNLVAIALNLERTLKIDLTVLGAKRTSALQRFFFRSTATEIIENAACDVLAVPVDTESE